MSNWARNIRPYNQQVVNKPIVFALISGGTNKVIRVEISNDLFIWK